MRKTLFFILLPLLAISFMASAQPAKAATPSDPNNNIKHGWVYFDFNNDGIKNSGDRCFCGNINVAINSGTIVYKSQPDCGTYFYGISSSNTVTMKVSPIPGGYSVVGMRAYQKNSSGGIINGTRSTGNSITLTGKQWYLEIILDNNSTSPTNVCSNNNTCKTVSSGYQCQAAATPTLTKTPTKTPTKAPTIAPTKTPTPTIASSVDPKGSHATQTCTTATGWACDPSDYSKPILVRFYNGPATSTGSNYIGETTANLPNSASSSQCGGNANHGFNFSVPASFTQATGRNIYAYGINIGSGVNKLLSSTPRIHVCPVSPTATQPPSSGISISGNVFIDANGNGIKDSGEANYTGLADVALSSGDGTKTNSSGNYSFTSLAAGTYIVTLTPPNGYIETTTNPKIVSVGPNNSTVNFGIRQSSQPTATKTPTVKPPTKTPTPRPRGNTATPKPPTKTPTTKPPTSTPTGSTGGSFSITGVVFVDTNSNGIKDSGENGYTSGTTVSLSSGDSTTTNSSGSYTFTSLEGGTYIVTADLPSGYVETSTNPKLIAIGPNNATVNFGIFNPNGGVTITTSPTPTNAPNTFSISGNVFIDTNSNGVKDSGESSYTNSGTVSLSSGDSTTTNISGDYTFTSLEGGTYIVTFTLPPDYVETTTNPKLVSIGPNNSTVNFGIFNPNGNPTGTGETVFALDIGMDGIGSTGDNANPNDSSGSNQNPLRATRNVSIEVYDTNNNLVLQKNGSIIYNSNSGRFEGLVNMGSTLTTGNYIIKIKSDGYLRRLTPGIQNVTAGETYDVPSVNLVVGDINSDNAINILDYNILLSCSIFTTDGGGACNQNSAFRVLSDLEDNGPIDQFDYNLFVREYSVQNGQ